MARKKANYCILFVVGADKKSAPDAAIIIDIHHEEKRVLLYPFEDEKEARKNYRAENRAFLSHAGVQEIVDELGGVEAYGRYMNGAETVRYIGRCKQEYREEDLMLRVRQLVSAIGHKADRVERTVLLSAAKKSLKFVSHDISAFKMLSLMGEIPEILNYEIGWGA